MKKEKVTLGLWIMNLFTRHIWLKIISLVLAVTTWLYVQGKIHP
jgi:hypothetical protein